MIIVPFIILVAVCVILGTFYAISGYDKSWQSILFKCLAPLSCLVLALVNANLSSSYGACTLLITIALAIMITFEAFSCSLTGKAKLIISSSCSFTAIILFAFAAVSLTNFTPWAILSGLFLGLGVMLVTKLVKKDCSWNEMAMFGLNFAATFILFMQSISTIIVTKTVIAAIFLLIGAIFMTTSVFLSTFSKNTKLFNILTSALRILSLILFASSIYFL